MSPRRGRGTALLAEDDVDPLAFVPNLFDAILVMTVASLVMLTAARAREAFTPPDPRTMQGFADTDVRRAGDGERLGGAYRLGMGGSSTYPNDHAVPARSPPLTSGSARRPRGLGIGSGDGAGR